MIHRAGRFSLQCALSLAGISLALSPAPVAAQASPAKKELVARIVQFQMAGVEQMAQSLVERPAALMLQDASQALNKRVAADLRGAAGKRIQDSVRRYVEETTPIVRARAVNLAPQVFGPRLEADFSEAELTQLLQWLESPVARKFQQSLPAVQENFMQKLVADSRPLVDPKLLRLEQEIRAALGLPPPGDSPAADLPAGRDTAAKKK